MILTSDLKAPGGGGEPKCKKNKSSGSLTATGKGYMGEISVAVIFYIFLSFGGENCQSLVIENFIYAFISERSIPFFVYLAVSSHSCRARVIHCDTRVSL